MNAMFFFVSMNLNQIALIFKSCCPAHCYVDDSLLNHFENICFEYYEPLWMMFRSSVGGGEKAEGHINIPINLANLWVKK